MSKEHVRILRAARKLVASGKERFICVAIKQTAREYVTEITYYKYTEPAVYDLLTLIAEALGNGSCTLEDWLLQTHGIDTYLEDRYTMRQYRLAWIDQMIEYWKDK